MATTFDRSISDGFVEALREAASEEGWWSDVLRDHKLLIAVRDEYLNVYWRGQSLFRVERDGEKLIATTHPKYLINPDLKDGIKLSESNYDLSNLLDQAFLRTPDINKMKRAANAFAGEEKRGVHNIVQRNNHVVDVEVALPGAVTLLQDASDDNAKSPSERKNPRVDVAALQSGDDGSIRIVFWEAKCYKNKELRARDRDAIKVCDQIEIYKAWLRDHRSEIEESYRKVADNMVALAQLRGVSPHNHLLAIKNDPRLLTLGDQPQVGLIVFGFDTPQRDWAEWKQYVQIFQSRFPFIAVGDAKNIRLPE